MLSSRVQATTSNFTCNTAAPQRMHNFMRPTCVVFTCTTSSCTRCLHLAHCTLHTFSHFHSASSTAVLQAVTGVPAQQQRLHWAGKQLSDNSQSLAAAGLADDALLQLSLPLRGGAPVKVGCDSCYWRVLQVASEVREGALSMPHCGTSMFIKS